MSVVPCSLASRVRRRQSCLSELAGRWPGASLITRRDAPNAVIMSQDYDDSMMETVYLLRSPANVAYLERSIAQWRKGMAKEGKLVEDAE
ncbi:Antitoxin Phd_YefM, type II toxin-antitoxin system [Burkholderia sp. b14]|nr:type II toxin-antitoxin system Phd/YefM family antitoxin [Mycetohabitans sp. B7]SIT70598.1 Antitoxin Phd_YefM, type II toxin-antitoxin system [Burkholderia sp. b14]